MSKEMQCKVFYYAEQYSNSGKGYSTRVDKFLTGVNINEISANHKVGDEISVFKESVRIYGRIKSIETRINDDDNVMFYVVMIDVSYVSTLCSCGKWFDVCGYELISLKGDEMCGDCGKEGK